MLPEKIKQQYGQRLDRRGFPKQFYVFSSVILLLFLAFLISSLVFSFIFFFLFFLLLFLFLLYLLFAKIYGQFYHLKDIADTQVYAPTQDGWNIAMHLHDPNTSRKEEGRYPVILCHGIASNKYSVDLNQQLSLAYFLKQEGYRVFVLSLRGAGKSYHNSQHRYKDFSFDDIVEYDVPAVIQKARELTGAPKINWVGHSMGAMIMQAFLGRRLPGHEDIASFVSIGGPGRLDHIRYKWWGALLRYPHFRRFFSLRSGAQLALPFLSQIHTPFHEIIYSKGNLHKRTVKYLLKNAVENIAKGLGLQLKGWIYSARESSVDGSFDYQQGLENIYLPALFIAGLEDKIAVPECVRFVWEEISSPEKKFVLLSKENNFSTDYCHMAMVMGEEAPKEVFPLVLDWLEQYGCERGEPQPKKLLE